MTASKKIMIITALENALPAGEPTWIPLSSTNAAGVLEKAGSSVVIFDRLARHAMGKRSLKLVDQEMLESLKGFAPDIILMDTDPMFAWDTARSFKKIRRVHHGRIGLMGPLASALPQSCFEHLAGLDFVVQGESEPAMPAVAKADMSRVPQYMAAGRARLEKKGRAG